MVPSRDIHPHRRPRQAGTECSRHRDIGTARNAAMTLVMESRWFRGRTMPRAAENRCRVTATVDSTLRGKKTRSCGTPLTICRRRTRQTTIYPCGARRSALGMSPTTPTQGATESRTASDRATPPVAPPRLLMKRRVLRCRVASASGTQGRSRGYFIRASPIRRSGCTFRTRVQRLAICAKVSRRTRTATSNHR